MRKSPDAFRTISEVAEDLDLPQHVLRFWETRFSQIKPMKRGGGRRYYRPDDIDLLRGIRHLLYDQGYTIKGVQKILKEQGIRQVIDAADPEGEGRDAEGQSPSDARQISDAYPAARHVIEEGGPVHRALNPAPAQPVIRAEVSNTPVHTAERQPEPHSVSSVPQVEPAHQPVHTVPTPGMVRQPTAPQTTAPQMTHPHEQSPVAQVDDGLRSEGTPEQSNMIDFRTHPKRSEQGPQPHQPYPPHVIPTTKAFTAPAPSGPAPAGARVRHAQYPQQGPVEAIGAVPRTEEEQRRRDFGEAGPLPADLRTGDPEFLYGGDASVTIEAARSRALEEEQRSGFFSRIIGSRSEAGEAAVTEQQRLSRDEVRRLQSTLFELLECKRILDQARSD